MSRPDRPERQGTPSDTRQLVGRRRTEAGATVGKRACASTLAVLPAFILALI